MAASDGIVIEMLEVLDDLNINKIIDIIRIFDTCDIPVVLSILISISLV